jgi:membrane-bound lytic murein transglycosylase F
MSKYYKKQAFIITWITKKQNIANKYINLYILPIVCTFGFSGSNSFKYIETPLSSSEEKCYVQKDIYFTVNENKNLNDLEKSIFIKKIDNRLPKYLGYFKKHTKNSIFSWKLIAAISYQESHWNHKAISKTKVKGLMMLTKDTASYIGVKNRLDPNESVYGGVKYLENIFKRLPSSIIGSDRIWMTLAAYNVGLGHLEDARVLTEKFGHNPNYWSDVKKHLPLLKIKKYYKKTKYGYARGSEPVRYVERIQAYLKIMYEEEKHYLASLSLKEFFNY